MGTIPISAIQATRPLLFEDDDFPDTPYFYQGTFTFVRWHGAVYAMTARHAMPAQGMERARLLCHDTNWTFLGYSEIATPTGNEEDFKDLFAFRVDQDATCPELSRGIISLTDEVVAAGRRAYSPDRLLVVSGYPGEIKHIRFDDKRLAHRRLVATGRYGKVDAGRSHIHQFSWQDLGGVTALGGMSGGVVLAEDNTAAFGVAGMLIQAGSPSGGGHFIDVAVLRAFLMALHG